MSYRAKIELNFEFLLIHYEDNRPFRNHFRKN